MDASLRSIKGKIYAHLQSLCLKKWLHTLFLKVEWETAQKLDAFIMEKQK